MAEAKRKRIYLVKCGDIAPKANRLVRASSAAQALKHVIDPMISASVPTQEDLVAVAKDCEIEEAAD